MCWISLLTADFTSAKNLPPQDVWADNPALWPHLKLDCLVGEIPHIHQVLIVSPWVHRNPKHSAFCKVKCLSHPIQATIISANSKDKPVTRTVRTRCRLLSFTRMQGGFPTQNRADSPNTHSQWLVGGWVRNDDFPWVEPLTTDIPVTGGEDLGGMVYSGMK